MNVLVIGGTRNIGCRLVWLLLAAGHRVTLLNRGRTADSFGNGVERLVADRTTVEFQHVLADREFDAAIDFVAYTPDDARQAVSVLGGGRVGHYVFISTGQVYLVRENCPMPSKESDFDGPLMQSPVNFDDLSEWRYGVDKREAEIILADAWRCSGFPVTCLRIPRVNSEQDDRRKIESYLWRIRDGGPVLIPDGGTQICRNVYATDVARAIADLIGKAFTYGEAYNLSQEEEPTLVELIGLVADAAGAPARLVPVASSQLASAGLLPVQVSPFSKRWSSRLDPAKANRELHFRHEPLRNYLDKIVGYFLKNPASHPPENYQYRPIELELAANCHDAAGTLENLRNHRKA